MNIRMPIVDKGKVPSHYTYTSSQNTMDPYTQGRKAFMEGALSSANPYTGKSSVCKDSRKVWYEGWYDQWRFTKWGPLPDEQPEPIRL